MSAGFGRRFAALLYDALLCAGLLMAYTGAALILTHGRAIIAANVGFWVYPYRAGLIAVLATYFSVCCARTGHTLGMRAWRLRLVGAGTADADTGRAGTDTMGNTPESISSVEAGNAQSNVSLRRALWRFALSIPAWGLGMLGVLWLYLDPQRLALQDRLSGTRVILLTT